QWTFRPGVQLTYYQRDLNFDKLTFGDQFDDTGLVRPISLEDFDTGLNANFFDISLGGILFDSRTWLGFSMHHVAEPNQSIAGGDAPLRKRISLHAGYKIPITAISPYIQNRSGKERSFTPSFNYRAQGDFDQLDVGFYLTLEPMLFGVWYRGVPLKTFAGTPNNESLVFLAGINAGKTSIGYSFDYTLSDLGIGSGGAHEISITYVFTLTPFKPPREVRELKCPVPFIF
ncbi:MAG: PorP/SprF family type IX secretion system membrane protein, partial [Cyclobacteriaceae bacterium]|nr:PorP/SprF family type IX secretion system membrane protein [Cyclobacteriaceae bacterium HetDA_MAG_MS6]